MTDAELITELTYHANIEKRKLLSDAADALEAAEKRIDNLQQTCNKLASNLQQAQLPKEGVWIEVHDWLQIPQEERGTYRCSACGQVMKYPWNFCPNCGSVMKGGCK